MFAANFLFPLIEPIKVFAQPGTPGSFHVGRQRFDVRLDRTVLRLVSGILPVAQKAAPLAQMIQRPAQRMPVFAAGQIELFGQRPEPVAIRILVRSIVGTLPADEFVGHRINALFPPRIQLLLRKRRTKVMLHQNPQQRDFAQPAPEVMPA